jgi:hypothetical protein
MAAPVDGLRRPEHLLASAVMRVLAALAVQAPRARMALLE